MYTRSALKRTAHNGRKCECGTAAQVNLGYGKMVMAVATVYADRIGFIVAPSGVNQMENVMRRFFVIISPILLLTLLLTSLAVSAAPQNALSVLYLDSANNIVGQKILYCSGIAVHSGNTATSYSISQSFGCSDPTVTCGPSETPPGGTQAFYTCSDSGLNNTVTFNYIITSTNTSKATYCALAPLEGQPFYGTPGCELPAPTEIEILQPYASGI